MRAAWSVVVVIVLAISFSGCSYSIIQAQDKQVKAGQSEIANQYQRRADLIPDLVSTIKGYASREKGVLTEVTEAHACIGAVQASSALLSDPRAFARFQSAQQ